MSSDGSLPVSYLAKVRLMKERPEEVAVDVERSMSTRTAVAQEQPQRKSFEACRSSLWPDGVVIILISVSLGAVSQKATASRTKVLLEQP